jgi:hypothetical protein
LITKLLLIVYTRLSQTTLHSESLGVHVGPIYVHITHENLPSIPKSALFLAIATYTKGSSALIYLQAAYIYIYISRDVIFDENVFPFSKLHENAGARLRSEILLLPPSLISSNGVANIELPMTNSSSDVFESKITNQSTAVHEIQEEGQSGDDQPRNQQMAQPATDSPENQCQSLAPIIPGATAEQESPLEGPTGSP